MAYSNAHFLSDTVCNIGVIVNCKLKFDSHILTITHKSHGHANQIQKFLFHLQKLFVNMLAVIVCLQKLIKIHYFTILSPFSISFSFSKTEINYSTFSFSFMY